MRFGLKSILSDIKMATLACFLCPFDWMIFLHPFYSEVMPILDVKACFLDTVEGNQPGCFLQPGESGGKRGGFVRN